MQTTDNGPAGPKHAFWAPAGQWSQVSVPFSALGNPGQIARINIQEWTGGTQAPFYMDELVLVGQ